MLQIHEQDHLQFSIFDENATVTLSFDWLTFAVKLVWRAAENRAYLIGLCGTCGLETGRVQSLDWTTGLTQTAKYNSFSAE